MKLKKASWGRCPNCKVGQLETIKLLKEDKYIGWAMKCNECGSIHKEFKDTKNG